MFFYLFVFVQCFVFVSSVLCFCPVFFVCVQYFVFLSSVLGLCPVFCVCVQCFLFVSNVVSFSGLSILDCHFGFL